MMDGKLKGHSCRKFEFRGQQQPHIGNHPVMTHRLIMSSSSSSENHATNFISTISTNTTAPN